MLDYTSNMYDKLCENISESDYKSTTVKDYILANEGIDKTIILRHDVDGKAEDALRLANIEKKYNLKSTYYFRKKSFSFKPNIIQKIEKLGHEVGYHYETLNDTDGNFEQAFRLFKINLSLFRKFCKVETVCAHGNLFKDLYNGDLWKKYDFKKLKLIGEAYQSINFDNCYYISDSGGSWNNLPRTSNFVNILKKGNYPVIYTLIHPENWTIDYISWIRNRFHDLLPLFLQKGFVEIKKIYTHK
jgi:hypothetical protein